MKTEVKNIEMKMEVMNIETKTAVKNIAMKTPTQVNYAEALKRGLKTPTKLNTPSTKEHVDTPRYRYTGHKTLVGADAKLESKTNANAAVVKRGLEPADIRKSVTTQNTKDQNSLQAPVTNAEAATSPEAAKVGPRRFECRFEFDSKIGKGSHGDVFTCRNRVSGKTLAVKLQAAPGRQIINEYNMYKILQYRKTDQDEDSSEVGKKNYTSDNQKTQCTSGPKTPSEQCMLAQKTPAEKKTRCASSHQETQYTSGHQKTQCTPDQNIVSDNQKTPRCDTTQTPTPTSVAVQSPHVDSHHAAARGGGIPRMHWFGTTRSDKHALVIDLLGTNLMYLFRKTCSGHFSTQTLVMIAVQLLDRLEFIHSRGVVHRDLKPENMVVGGPENCNTLFLVDFGLAKEIISNDGTHIPYSRAGSFVGNMLFASVGAHFCHTVSRRDDLESLGYNLLYLASRGALPWDEEFRDRCPERSERIGEKKKSCTIPSDVLNGKLADYVSYSKALRFNEKPDYEFCRNLFRSALPNCPNSPAADGKFDWEENVSVRNRAKA